jgi:O-antigen ligase
MILFDKVRITSLWLIGVLACICRWDPAVISKSLVFLVCLCLCLVIFFHIIKKGQIKKSFFLQWYGSFFIFVLFSLLYTANHIDANDIVRRCFLGFVLGFVASQLVELPTDLKCIMKGLVLGSLITLGVTLKMEADRIGLMRMGNVTCGAATAYSGILLIGMICLFVLNQIEKYRIYVFGELILLVGIILSGSRMPLLVAGGVFLGFKIVESESIYKTVANVMKVVVVVVVSAYAVMVNPILYDVAGKRFETMLESIQYGTDENTDNSLKERHEMKIEALLLWSRSPIFGQGVNSFWVLSPVHNGRASSHCGYTEILCSFGILGFILFYWPFLKPFAKIARLKIDLKMSFTVALLAFLITDWQGGYFDSCTHIVFLYVVFQYMQFLEMEEKNTFGLMLER